MRLQINLICLAGIFFTIMDTRAYYSYLNNRPVIDLNNKPKPTTLKLPHERRSALFPKGHLNLAVDTEISENVSPHSPNKESLRNPVIQNIHFNPEDQEWIENIHSKQTGVAPKIVYSRKPKNNIANTKATVTEQKSMKFNYPTENVLSNISNEKKNDNEGNFPIVSKKRKEASYVFIPTNSESDDEFNMNGYNPALLMPEQKHDTKEDYLNILALSPNGNVNERSKEDESQEAGIRKRRSVNIIEEESLATTVTGFKFTGRESRVISHQSFRNINS